MQIEKDYTNVLIGESPDEFNNPILVKKLEYNPNGIIKKYKEFLADELIKNNFIFNSDEEYFNFFKERVTYFYIISSIPKYRFFVDYNAPNLTNKFFTEIIHFNIENSK